MSQDQIEALQAELADARADLAEAQYELAKLREDARTSPIEPVAAEVVPLSPELAMSEHDLFRLVKADPGELKRILAVRHAARLAARVAPPA